MRSDVSVVGYEHPAVLRIQANSMGVFQSRSVATEHAEGFILPLGILVIHNHHWRILDSQKHLFAGFVYGDSIGSMRCAQFPRGMHVATLVT